MSKVLALAAILSGVHSQVVHVVTTPASAAVANQPLWTTLCDDACDTSYDQMGLPPDNVRDHDATDRREGRGGRSTRARAPGSSGLSWTVTYYGEPEALVKIAQTRAARDQASVM